MQMAVIKAVYPINTWTLLSVTMSYFWDLAIQDGRYLLDTW